MVLGFNHNIMYKGIVFHIQTEDSGLRAPNITTLLYREGIILKSMKTSYSGIINGRPEDAISSDVEALMKEQHKEMLRRLKTGEFDSKAFGDSAARSIHESAPIADHTNKNSYVEPVEQIVVADGVPIKQLNTRKNTTEHSTSTELIPIPSSSPAPSTDPKDLDLFFSTSTAPAVSIDDALAEMFFAPASSQSKLTSDPKIIRPSSDPSSSLDTDIDIFFRR